MFLKKFSGNKLFKIKNWIRTIKAHRLIKAESALSAEVLNNCNRCAKHIFLCCVPTHGNMGDQAQRFCIEKWCRENYPEYELIPLTTWPFYSKQFRRKFGSYVKPDDLIIIHSGYCTTSRHKDHPVHRYLVKTFKNIPILVMPQTVNFILDKDGYKTGKIYSSHKKLCFLARDMTSYKYAKKFFYNTNVILYPDIVTTLIGTMNFDTQRKGILFCIRNDSEKKYPEQEINALKDKLMQTGIPCKMIDTNTNTDIQKLQNNFSSELHKLLDLFAQHTAVITDRYHGTIFSMIANTPVIVLETNDHKVRTGTEWFTEKYSDSFFNAGDLDEAYKIAMTLIKENRHIHNCSFFYEEYYSCLKKIFEENINNAEKDH